MTYNVSSGTLNPTIPYHTISCKQLSGQQIFLKKNAFAFTSRKPKTSKGRIHNDKHQMIFVDGPNKREPSFTFRRGQQSYFWNWRIVSTMQALKLYTL